MSAMLGQSGPFLLVMEQLKRYASCDVHILVEGETGTGKELAAREIHYASARRGCSFVPVNCGALPDSLIESELFGHERGAYTDAKQARAGLIDQARGGTLFLDEVDSLSGKAQVTLLRLLENNEYRPVGGDVTRSSNVRVIAATNSCLEERVTAGQFRRDLQYRLNALHIRLPSLRERADDLPLLAEHFIGLVGQRLSGPRKHWSCSALLALAAYHWPGNVRELENISLRAYIRAEGNTIDASVVGDVLGMRALPSQPILSPENLPYMAAKERVMLAFERDYLTNLMKRSCGNVTAAARMCEMERRQLGKLLKKHGIDTREFRLSPQPL
ncbi:sigma 54-interacting transcriptional regulator [Dyella choica]|uniref:Sigma-54-dependent Fis family transcriptional regulator n=1 Tax=Dyella choica TaxID=1927959 RepID=A0A432MBC4_9GAMM|nr:sigma-54 dependent transcriptional regulator [Dyella choica]RUL78940.1 sigma-54-dependent Fis family transcriptional regulator [Dyella choica]